VVIEPTYHEAGDFHGDQWAIAAKGDRRGWIDRAGVWQLELPELEAIGSFDACGMALVKTSRQRGWKYGWINRRGQWVIPPNWQQADPFGQLGKPFEDLAVVVRRESMSAIIHRDGQTAASGQSFRARSDTGTIEITRPMPAPLPTDPEVILASGQRIWSPWRYRLRAGLPAAGVALLLLGAWLIRASRLKPRHEGPVPNQRPNRDSLESP
jgi:hypothetical protein